MNKIIAVDIDGVLVDRSNIYEHEGINKYNHCYPIHDMIKIVNKLYDDGFTIRLLTSRGMTQFNGDYHVVYNKLYELTRKQMTSFGIKYHELFMGKPHYNILIDDHAMYSGDITDSQSVISKLS